MSTEDRLRAALEATAGAVREDTLRPLTPRGRAARRWPRMAAPFAAAMAVLLILGVVDAVARTSAPVAPAASASPVAGVGGFPTGIAVDQANHTVYVASGDADDLAVINAATCTGTKAARCAPVATANTAGQDPIGVAVDEQTQTVYVVNGQSGTVAVINAAACDATTTKGCKAKPALVKVPGAPEFLAADPQTDAIYVADLSSGDLSIINGKACNASDTSGCAKAPGSIHVGTSAWPIAVDAATGTVYVGTDKDVVVVDGRSCDSADTTGCAKVLATVPVGQYPAGIAVDAAANAVYVSSESGTVTVLDRGTCSTLATSGCGEHRTVATGSDPRGDAVDAASSTAYVTNAGSGTVSMIDTRTCGSGTGCGHTPPSFPVGESPRRVAIDTATNTVFVVNTGAGTLSVIDGATCNATDTHGCPSKPPAVTSGGVGGLTSSCRPTTVAATSGQPAGPLTSGATRVATGTVGGQAWSLWAKNGVGRPDAIEDGGLVLGGRWYGLCAGFPNVAEFELLNAGPHGIVLGFIQQPGKFTVALTGTGKLPSPEVTGVQNMSFFIGQLPGSACSYPQMLLQASDGSVFSALHHLQFGTCAPNKLVQITGSYGEWGQGRLSGTGLGSVAVTVGGGSGWGSPPNRQERCDAVPTTSGSGHPAGPLTKDEVRVASGTIAGQAWGLWASKGATGVAAVENGGLVLGGRWYGLCPGTPNPSEFELIDTPGPGLAYGYVANPGDYTFTTSPAGALSGPQAVRVMGGTFFISPLGKPACAYHSLILYASTKGVRDLHQHGFGGCHANQLVTFAGGYGIW